MTNYVAAGFDPAVFWLLTPRELSAHMEGAGLKLQRQNNERLTLAWVTAALHRAKDMPRLEAMLQKAGNRKPQSWQQQAKIAEQWNAALNARK